MLQDSNSKIPPPFNPINQRPSQPPYSPGQYTKQSAKDSPANSKHRVDIDNLEGYKALKTIMKVQNVIGVIMLVLAGLAVLAGIIMFIIGISESHEGAMIYMGLLTLIFGPLIFGLASLGIYAARDSIKIKIEHLEVTYKLLDAVLERR